MFFFIGVVQPKVSVLDTEAGQCPSCGAPAVSARRVDHYLTLFFLPLFPVKRGTPFLECRECGGLFDTHFKPLAGGSGERTCPGCGKKIFIEYSWCPWCGRKV